MNRVHAFEILDLPGCPQFLRDAGTDFLEFVSNLADGYAGIVDRLAHALERTGSKRIVDLCSGGGGPWVKLLPALEAKLGDPIDVCLTDLSPNVDALERTRCRVGEHLSFLPTPVDAMDVPSELHGFRTMFAGFHHFRADDARAILSDAVGDGVGIAIFEGTARHPLFAIPMLLVPIETWLFTPFIRPVRWWRIVFTYLIPVIPLVILFDGIVSCLRTYSPEELQRLVDELDAPHYRWEIGVERMGRLPIGVTYLIGYPDSVAA